ncbi:hypothetical protein HDA32_000427 [Spinactinospora alkalitolerans]|uniref:Uncharacterized protein n=1 Tax=Spinactinospora alkalitolerans TaxID=687207 RepID=A0A852TPV2_9ACTN|nr:hypothetical protein [Spinactinospora alkalitolerans]NYE45307.1 hypothetical protein [Spinactinospora alkalitolerans]
MEDAWALTAALGDAASAPADPVPALRRCERARSGPASAASYASGKQVAQRIRPTAAPVRFLPKGPPNRLLLRCLNRVGNVLTDRRP